jgi:hypothetical protein
MGCEEGRRPFELRFTGYSSAFVVSPLSENYPYSGACCLPPLGGRTGGLGVWRGLIGQNESFCPTAGRDLQQRRGFEPALLAVHWTKPTEELRNGSSPSEATVCVTASSWGPSERCWPRRADEVLKLNAEKLSLAGAVRSKF